MIDQYRLRRSSLQNIAEKFRTTYDPAFAELETAGDAFSEAELSTSISRITRSPLRLSKEEMDKMEKEAPLARALSHLTTEMELSLSEEELPFSKQAKDSSDPIEKYYQSYLDFENLFSTALAPRALEDSRSVSDLAGEIKLLQSTLNSRLDRIESLLTSIKKP